jgi:hypothetical protein
LRGASGVPQNRENGEEKNPWWSERPRIVVLIIKALKRFYFPTYNKIKTYLENIVTIQIFFI